jgi:hypothetical protein
MLADSEESVESDEEFYFVDDNRTPSPKKKNLASSSMNKSGVQRLKVTVKGAEQASLNSEFRSELPSNGNSEDFNVSKPDDFARMMATFDGFSPDDSQKNIKSVRSYKNKLFTVTHPEVNEREERSSDCVEVTKLEGNTNTGTNAPSGVGDSEAKPDIPNKENNETGGNKDDTIASTSLTDSSANDSSDSKSVTNENSDAGKSLVSEESTGSMKNKITVSKSTVSSNGKADNNDELKNLMKDTDKQNIDKNMLVEGKKDLANASQKDLSTVTQTELKPSSLEEPENAEIASSAINTSAVNRSSEGNQKPERNNELTISQDSPNSSTSSNTLEKDTYITVLPRTGDTKDSSDGTMGSDPDSRFSKTGKTHSKCLSYIVVSGGEGQVDLRLKVKSKQDLKKDAQSMFLIWRVNSKI